MFPNPPDGSCADRAPGTVGAAHRRRDRRLRAFLKHERMTVAMNMATIQHHSYMKSAVVDVSVQVGSPLAPVTEYVAPAPAMTLSVPSQQLRPAYTSATVATGVNLDVTGFVSPLFSRTALEGSVSQVVGPLPPADGFTEPVCNQVHCERFAASETAENLVDIPVVLEQVLVQAIPEVVGSLPSAEQFTGPVYNQAHHEQFAAGETTENLAEFPVVSEQVIVHAIPRVAGSLVSVDEFTPPVYNPVHQEHFSAGETTENTAIIPVVQDEVLVQAIPRVVGSLPPVEEFTAYVARRPSPLVEVRPSVRAQRHIVEDLGELAPLVQILDLPVPQSVDSVTDVLRLLDRPIAEQVITVPTVSCSSCPSRSRVPEPQSAEQLVEVPTVLTPTRIAVQIAEQIVDTSVPRGRARGSVPGQSSAARRPAQSSRRRFAGRIWHMPAAGQYGFIESDSAKAAYAFVGDVPFFLAGSCRLGDHVTFAVGRGADGLEAYDLKVVGRG